MEVIVDSLFIDLAPVHVTRAIVVNVGLNHFGRRFAILNKLKKIPDRKSARRIEGWHPAIIGVKNYYCGSDFYKENLKSSKEIVETVEEKVRNEIP